MKKYFVVIVLVVGMLALSCSSFAQQAQKPAEKDKPAKPGKPVQMAPLTKLKEYLNLTPEQETKLKDFQKARAEEENTVQEQIKKMHSELAKLLEDPKADQNKINSLIDQTAKMRAERMKKALATRRELEKIFTSEQFDKLKQFRGNHMRRGPLDGFFMGMSPFMQRGRFMGPGMLPGMGFGMGHRFMGRQDFRSQRWFDSRWGRGMRMMRRPGMRFRMRW